MTNSYTLFTYYQKHSDVWRILQYFYFRDDNLPNCESDKNTIIKLLIKRRERDHADEIILYSRYLI